MAIERYAGLSLSDLKDLIDGLGWFAASDTDGNGNIIWYADEEKTKAVLQVDSTGANWSFSHDGDMGNHHIDVTGSFPSNAYKTKNGLLLSSVTAYASSYWGQYAMIIGKTNNNAVAVAMQTNGNGPYALNISAYGDAARALGTVYFGASTNRYDYSPQIVTAPLATCPAAGTSYIKGAVGLLVAPWQYYWGEVDIGGVRYATNGYIGLNDAD